MGRFILAALRAGRYALDSRVRGNDGDSGGGSAIAFLFSTVPLPSTVSEGSISWQSSAGAIIPETSTDTQATFSAPTPGVYTITATSVDDPAQSAVATVTVSLNFADVEVPPSWGIGTTLRGIDAAGRVYGNYYLDGSNRSHGFVKDGANVVTIDYPGAGVTHTRIDYVNALGQLAGIYTGGGGNHYFVVK